MSKCPYCYRSEDTWKKDPILIPNGSKYKWQDSTEITLIEESDITKRLYKGLYQVSYEEIKEIQDQLKDLEEENLLLINRTDFSPVNDGGIFQFTGKHLKEMRDSVEKLLVGIGLTKIEYFNYDENENHIIRPGGDISEWTDPITLATDLQQFQIKYIHIEELRHYIQSFWRERWTELLYFDSLSRIVSGEEGPWQKSDIVNFEGDYNWNSSTLSGLYYYMGGYLISGEVTSEINCNNNFSWSSYGSISTQAVMYNNWVLGKIEIKTNDINVNLTEKTNIIIENILFASTQNKGGDRPEDAGITNYFYIKVTTTTKGSKIYLFGTASSDPDIICITEGRSYSGNWQRNLYNDFGGNTVITSITIQGYNNSNINQSFSGITWSNCSINLSLGTISLKNIYT